MKYTINELANSKGVSPLVREALLQMEEELDATNRQVEILSDALSESRREIDAMVAFAHADEREAWERVCDQHLRHIAKLKRQHKAGILAEREAVEDLLKEYDMVNSAFARDFRARRNT